jgi:hypothetical protein
VTASPAVKQRFAPFAFAAESHEAFLHFGFEGIAPVAEGEVAIPDQGEFGIGLGGCGFIGHQSFSSNILCSSSTVWAMPTMPLELPTVQFIWKDSWGHIVER